jgi:cytochrome bd-type quinol oxidase subunit 2
VIDFPGRPIYKLVITGLYIVNAAVLCGIAAIATDPRLDWHDYAYPASVGAALMLSVELLAFRWQARRRDPGNIESFGWLWVFTVVFLAATMATWVWTFDKHQDDLAGVLRVQTPPPGMMHVDPNAMQLLQKLQDKAASQP